MKKQNLMPECFYQIDTSMSIDKLKRAELSGEFVTGKVIYWDSIDNFLLIDLGNNFTGIIPLHEFTLYNEKSVYYLIGKEINAYVKSTGNVILLSRRETMIDSFNQICEGDELCCFITNVSKRMIFLDAGNGMNGIIQLKDLTVSRITNPNILGFYKNQVINARVREIDYDKYKIILNYKDMFENLAYVLQPGEVVEVIVLAPVNNLEDGYFAYINPNTPAIIDVPYGIKIAYGSRVLGIVKNPNLKHPERLKLNFVSFVD